MKNFILTTLFMAVLAVSAFAAPVADAGSNLTVIVGEAIRLDGSASSGYLNESQPDGTWSIRWQTGDGYDAENVIKCPHVYMTAGVYTATLTVKDASGGSSAASITVTAQDIPTPAASNIQILTDSGNVSTNTTNLQNALNRAAANSSTNEIIVPAGFVFNDPMVLPARSATNYVTIRVADLSALPANIRVTASDKSKLFRMNMRGAGSSGYNNGVEMSYGAQYYRIIGMEIRKTVSETNTDMIGSLFENYSVNQNHIIIDRSLLDGNGFDTRKGAVLNGQTMSVLNSSILNIKARGVETKAIANWIGGGALAVINCRLEAAGINSLIGGAPVSSAAEVVDGYVFRGNYVWKDPQWIGFGIKNLFELKHGYNTVSVGNIFENNYSDAQTGEAILIKSQTDEGCAYCEVRNVDFRNNKILNVRAGFNVVNLQAFTQPFPVYANHIRFANNFWQQTNGRGNLSQGADFFEVIHNTFTTTDNPDNPVSAFMVYTTGSSGVPGTYKAPGYKLLNNLAYDAYYFNYSLASDIATGTGALNGYLGSDWDMRRNVIGNVIPSFYPADNFYPTSVKPEFVDYAGGNFNLKADSVYKGAATDGKDIGADIEVVNSSTTSATSGIWNSANPAPTPTPNATPTPTPTITPTPSPTPTPNATPTPTPTPNATPTPKPTPSPSPTPTPIPTPTHNPTPTPTPTPTITPAPSPTPTHHKTSTRAVRNAVFENVVGFNTNSSNYLEKSITSYFASADTAGVINTSGRVSYKYNTTNNGNDVSVWLDDGTNICKAVNNEMVKFFRTQNSLYSLFYFSRVFQTPADSFNLSRNAG